MKSSKPVIINVYSTSNAGAYDCVRLSDYEAMKDAYEEELLLMRLDRDIHFSTMAQAVEQIAKLEAECEKLREDAEFGRSVLSKREPGKQYGCHCDLEDGMGPDGCVIDSGERFDCVYARHIEEKEQCEYWRVIVTDSIEQASLIAAAHDVQGEPVGRVKTVGGYPDESEHTIEWLCKYKDLKDGDLLYAGPRPAEQPTPDVEALVEALEGIMRVEARDRVMPVGAEWDAARAALAAYRKGVQI